MGAGRTRAARTAFAVITSYSIHYTKLYDRAARYARQLELGLFAKPWKLSPRPKEVPAWDSLSDAEMKWEAERMAVFAGMVDCLDRNIGPMEGGWKIDVAVEQPGKPAVTATFNVDAR